MRVLGWAGLSFTVALSNARPAEACSPVEPLCAECGFRLTQALEHSHVPPDFRLGVELRCAALLSLDLPHVRTAGGERIESEWRQIFAHDEIAYYERLGPALPAGAVQLVSQAPARCGYFEGYSGTSDCPGAECCQEPSAEELRADFVLAEFEVTPAPLPQAPATRVRCQRVAERRELVLQRDGGFQTASHAHVRLLWTDESGAQSNEQHFLTQVCNLATGERAVRAVGYHALEPLPRVGVPFTAPDRFTYEIRVGNDWGEPELLVGEVADTDCVAASETTRDAATPDAGASLATNAPLSCSLFTTIDAGAAPDPDLYRAYADLRFGEACANAFVRGVGSCDAGSEHSPADRSDASAKPTAHAPAAGTRDASDGVERNGAFTAPANGGCNCSAPGTESKSRSGLLSGIAGIVSVALLVRIWRRK